jgi:hypothetical protein
VGRDALGREIDLLDEGRGCLTLAGFRAVEVGGADAVAWLQDLVTADVAALTAGEAARSLLLGPTGRIRADLHVLREPEGLLLLQTLDQPVRVDDLLAPYVLSSDVVLLERPSPELVALPGVLGWAFRSTPPENLQLVSAAALETWRIRRGLARFPSTSTRSHSRPRLVWTMGS